MRQSSRPGGCGSFRALDGDAAPFGGAATGTRIPRGSTLSDRMPSGAIDNVVPDVTAEPAEPSSALSQRTTSDPASRTGNSAPIAQAPS